MPANLSIRLTSEAQAILDRYAPIAQALGMKPSGLISLLITENLEALITRHAADNALALETLSDALTKVKSSVGQSRTVTSRRNQTEPPEDQ